MSSRAFRSAIEEALIDLVAEGRRLRLTGYEVYRFGGAELMKSGADKMVADFFDQLADRMRRVEISVS